MKSLTLKLFLCVFLLSQVGCAIKFKRKSTSNAVSQSQTNTQGINISEKERNSRFKSGEAFSQSDIHLISSYYADKANTQIKNDMLLHTRLSAEQDKKLVVGEFIHKDIQVIPLPLNLKKLLSDLPLDVLRVQVGNKIILMNVKTRKILDIIKI